MRFELTQFSLLTAALLTVASPSSAEQRKSDQKPWRVGVPIVTYWAGPAMTDDAARQMREGGWNVVWCTQKELDTVARHGLRGQLTSPLLNPAVLDDPAKKSELDALIDRVKVHPALYSYFLNDEPSVKHFPALGRLVAYLRERDPAHLAYVNLFPTYATNEQLGTTGDTVTAYRDYLQQYINVVKPGLVSYDFYQFAVGSDYPDYFLNLALVRRACLDAGLPFLNIVQACTWTPGMREPTEAEMRYLVYTTAAYGAQGISYYVYSHPGHSPGIATLEGKPTPVYGWLQKLNPEFAAIAAELQPLQSIGVYHAGMLPPGAEPLPASFAISLDPPLPAEEFKPGSPVRGLLIGSFGKRGKGTTTPSHVLVVNLDYGHESTFRLRSSRTLGAFDAATKKWSTIGKNPTLQLPPGGGRLVRLR